MICWKCQECSGLGTVGALDRLAHENHVFTDLTAAVAHARLHADRA